MILCCIFYNQNGKMSIRIFIKYIVLNIWYCLNILRNFKEGEYKWKDKKKVLL